MSFVRLLLAAVFAAFLAGCQQPLVQDQGGATGSLGSPLAGPSPADVYIQLSGAYLKEGNLTESFKNAKKATIVDPSSSDGFLMLGLINQRLAETAAAEDAFRRSLTLDARNPSALNAYGSFLCKQARFEEADSQFRLALKNPLYRTPWFAAHNAAACRERSGRLDEAETDYRTALRANPRFAPSLLSMARLSYDKGNYLSARAYLQRFEEVAKHTAESLWLGVRTENQLDDKDQMASYGLKLRARYPDSEEAKYLQSIE